MSRAIVTLLLFASCTSATAPAPALRPLASGHTAAYRGPRQLAILAFGDRALADIWKDRVGSGEVPQVDFTKEMAVILLAGQQPTGGYWIEPHRYRVEGRVLIVEATLHRPAPDAGTTQALTSPWAAITVPLVDVDVVRWKQ